MAFSFNNGGGNGRRRGGPTALSEINIIPLVDVVLVLLIIFMLTAHVMEFGLEVEVPKVNLVRNSAEELPVVSITKTGDLYLNEGSANINSLAAELKRRFPGQKAVYLRADAATIYEPIAQTVGVLGEAGFDVRLVTQPLDESKK